VFLSSGGEASRLLLPVLFFGFWFPWPLGPGFYSPWVVCPSGGCFVSEPLGLPECFPPSVALVEAVCFGFVSFFSFVLSLLVQAVAFGCWFMEIDGCWRMAGGDVVQS
jgi:hypothetical protein